MSTYLLLRNNKQTGPFILDELKKMSLKAYDLVWVEGKSAAWRYPGEIAELASFAPAVPEQPYDRFFKKAVPETSLKNQNAFDEVKPAVISVIPALQEVKPAVVESKATPAFATIAQQQIYPDQNKEYRDESQPQRIQVNQKRENRKSVYINLPAAEKKLSGPASVPPAHEPIDLDWDEPREPVHVKIPSTGRKAGRKGLLIASVMLFFMAGMLTGFYISNRRNYYSTDGNTPQPLTPVKSPGLTQTFAEQNKSLSGRDENKNVEPKQSLILPEQNIRTIPKSKKKQETRNPEKNDSFLKTSVPLPASTPIDSVRRIEATNNKLTIQADRIKAHPEEFLFISTGNYKTGLLGGISEAPVSVTNRSGVTMDLVVVAIDYILHNKKIFKTENLSFHNLAPGTTATAEAPKSPRGAKITHRLTVANSQQIGMAYSHFK